jgi:hypothetical protein
MAGSERVLVAPSRAELAQALRETVGTANGRCRERRLPWPLPGSPEELADAGTPAGWRQWNGGEMPGRSGEARSALALVWWTDHVGRRHFRAVGRRGGLTRRQMNNLLDPNGHGWPPLALVHPEHVFFESRGGGRRLAVTCACGAYGEPEQLGWMGERCGPCHDRREEGREAPPAWPGGVRPAVTACRRHSVPYAHFLAISPDGRAVAASDGEGWVRIWDVCTGRHRWLLKEVLAEGGEESAELTCAAFAPDGALLTGSRGGQIGRWDIETGERQPLFRLRGWVHAVTVSPDSSLLAVADPGEAIAIWEMEAARFRHRRLGGRYWAGHLVFSPDSKLLAGGRWDGRVMLWDVGTGTERPGPADSRGEVSSISFTADGRALAVGLLGRMNMQGGREPLPALLWDVVDQAVRVSLAGAYITHCALLTPDGGMLVTGGEDRIVRAWDVRTGQVLLALEWHRTAVCGLAFSADGRLLASGSRDGAVRLWPWDLLSPRAEGMST